MTKSSKRSKANYQPVIFTLPRELLVEAEQFAAAFHSGNNSGFVAAAIRHYIDHLRKVRHTKKLRESYAAAVADARRAAEDWDDVSHDVL